MKAHTLGGLGMVLLLAGCDAELKTPVGGDETVQMNADGDGRVAFDLPFAKGEIKLPAAMMAGGNLDLDGVKLPEGSSMSGFNLDAKDGQGAKVNLSFKAPMTPDAAKTYFIDQFRAHGVEARMVADAIQGTTKDGAAFVLRLAPSGTGTSGTISINDPG